MKTKLPQTSEDRFITEVRNLRRELADLKNSMSYFQIFYLGLLDVDIVGGTLDGVTYSAYVLSIRVHYEFAKLHQTTAMPFYQFWGYSEKNVLPQSSTSIVANELPELTLSGAGLGSAVKTTAHHEIYKASDPADEYVELVWNVVRSGSDVTIDAQNVKTWLSLTYANKTVSPSPITVQGGGGGILYEQIDLYI